MIADDRAVAAAERLAESVRDMVRDSAKFGSDVSALERRLTRLRNAAIVFAVLGFGFAVAMAL